MLWVRFPPAAFVRDDQNMPLCSNCGEAFPNSLIVDGKLRILNRRRYCLVCSPFGRHNTRKIHQARSTRAMTACLACGQKTPNPRYCSNQCQRDHEWQQVVAKIKATGRAPVGTSGQCRFAKRYLLEFQGRVCAICGLSEWRGQPVPLVLDHINGDSADWQISNLRLVCGNCDMQLPTFKSKNRGKGRAWRRQRYSDGKSY